VSFGDEVGLPDEPEIPDLESSHRVALELTGPDAVLLRLLGERLGLQPPSVVRIALITLASDGHRWR
jgi:hypothetical protein